jgi:hypothetical protein
MKLQGPLLVRVKQTTGVSWRWFIYIYTAYLAASAANIDRTCGLNEPCHPVELVLIHRQHLDIFSPTQNAPCCVWSPPLASSSRD